MYDLFQNYVSDLNKLRDAFHSELAATAENLSKAMELYASRSEAALASLMEQAANSWRGARSGGRAEARTISRFAGKRRSFSRRQWTGRAYANKCG